MDWDYYVKSSEELNGSFSSQIICGLRTEDEHDIPDEVFWSEENRYDASYGRDGRGYWSDCTNVPRD